jgi:hypothetical protein
MQGNMHTSGYNNAFLSTIENMTVDSETSSIRQFRICHRSNLPKLILKVRCVCAHYTHVRVCVCVLVTIEQKKSQYIYTHANSSIQ